MRKIYLSKGFTLVEILVVIVIISILASVALGSFQSSRIEAKNKAVMAQVEGVQIAIELYKAQNGEYPDNLSDLTSGDFIASLPDSSSSANSSCNYSYEVDAGNTWYKFTAENCLGGFDSASDGIQADDPFALCPTSCSSGNCSGSSYDTSDADFYESLAVYSNGGQCE